MTRHFDSRDSPRGKHCLGGDDQSHENNASICLSCGAPLDPADTSRSPFCREHKVLFPSSAGGQTQQI